MAAVARRALALLLLAAAAACAAPARAASPPAPGSTPAPATAGSASVAAGSAAHRLALFPLGERTHMLVYLELAAELAARGHEVHLITPACHQAFANATLRARRPAAAALPNLHYLPYPLDCPWVERDKRRAAAAGQLHGLWMIVEALAGRMDAILSDEGTMSALRALAARGLDLMVADPIGFGPLLPLALGVPHIDFDVGTAGVLFEPIFYGAQAAPAYIPAVATFLPTNGMGLLQRAANFAAAAAGQAAVQAVYFSRWGLVQRVLAKHNLTLRWPYTKPLLHLVNSNFALEPPRPVGPITKYIGPLLPAPARPLPADLAAWLGGAGPLGAVLVSFGGTLAAPAAASRAVLAAAAALPGARFLWKLSEEEQADLGGELAAAVALGNLKVSSWLPQNDVLGHLQLRAFVTQGGFLSIAEAAYHGVPIVGIPLLAGQGELIRFAADQGRGVMLPKSALMRGDARRLASAIHTVLTRPSFAAAAALASERLRAARRPYRQQAADWVEYAAALRAHGSFLHTQGQLLGSFRTSGADLALLCAAGAAAGWWAVGRAAAARRARRAAARGGVTAAVWLRRSGSKGVGAVQGAAAAPAGQAAAAISDQQQSRQVVVQQAAARQGEQAPQRRLRVRRRQQAVI